MSVKNLLCLVVDGLHAGMVGAYGNSWIRTIAIDRFASQSLVFDQAYGDRPTLDAAYDALWGEGATSGNRDPDVPSFASLASSQGWKTVLVTDEPRVAQRRGAADFGDVVLVEQPPATALACEATDTNLARLFDAAVVRLSRIEAPFVMWVHAQGMIGPWDAPYAFRERFADEEDPRPPTFATPPNQRLPDDYDPDALLGTVHAYSGQMALLDQMVGTLVDAIGTSPHDRTTQVSLLSARGFPLGEHRRVGLCDEALFNELTQLVWMMRFPDGLGSLDRTSALVMPSDLPGTLLNWLGVDDRQCTPARSLLPLVRGETSALRDRVAMASRSDRALRTMAWLLRKPADAPTELFAKPSDRWEVNDVAKLCPEIVAGMDEALEQTVPNGVAEPLSTLAPALTTEVD